METTGQRSDFREWLSRSGMSMRAMGKLCGFSTSTIRNIVNGKPPLFKTVKKLVRVTKDFEHPITYEMFPHVFMRGYNRLSSATDILTNLPKK